MTEEVKAEATEEEVVSPSMEAVGAPAGEEPDFKALFIKERYERIVIEMGQLQQRFAALQKEKEDIEQFIKANNPEMIQEAAETPAE